MDKSFFQRKNKGLRKKLTRESLPRRKFGPLSRIFPALNV